MSNTNETQPTAGQQPADWPPANATAEMLHHEIDLAEGTIATLAGQIEKAERRLAEDRRLLAEQEAHLRRMQTLAAIVAGRVPLPAPREVCEYPDGSVRIGVLVFPHPGEDASEDDLRFFAASMRAIYDVATPAATRAIGAANAKRHQGEQADVPTGAFPAVQPGDDPEAIPAWAWPFAKYVGRRVAIELDDGIYEGLFELDANGSQKFCLGGLTGDTSFMIHQVSEIKSIRLAEPAEVSDAVVASPSATQPDGQVTE